MKCGKPVETMEQEYCQDCAKQKHIFDQGRGLWIQKQPVSRGIYQFKFHNKRYYASVFAEEMMKRYGEWIYRNEIEEIIPIPLYKAKQRKRGFNQALLIAKELSILSGIPVNENAVFRIRNKKQKKTLNPMERSRNLKGAFGDTELVSRINTYSQALATGAITYEEYVNQVFIDKSESEKQTIVEQLKEQGTITADALGGYNPSSNE